MTNEQQVLNEEYLRTISHLNELWQCVIEHKWEHEQFVLNRLDELNELSTRN